MSMQTWFPGSGRVIVISMLLFCQLVQAQDSSFIPRSTVHFPRPMSEKWTSAVGFTTTTMPSEITEEVQFRVPAGLIHVNRKLGNGFYLDGLASIQFVQNLVTIGPRWALPLNDRLSLSLGNDLGYWFGFINSQGLKTKGSGWQNYPNLTLGYKFRKKVVLSLKAESLMNFGIKTYAGKTRVSSDYRLFSGSAYTLALEQPFYGKKGLVLAFRAIYSDFFWQTWTLFEPYDRNLFFPQLIAAVIL